MFDWGILYEQKVLLPEDMDYQNEILVSDIILPKEYKST